MNRKAGFDNEILVILEPADSLIANYALVDDARSPGRPN